MLKKIIIFTVTFFALLGCSPKPEPVIWGSETCNHCAMKLEDYRFGGLILTQKGKSYKFDSLECLLRFQAQKLDINETIRARYVFHSFKKGEMIELEKAHFLRVPNLNSPMGIGVLASDSAEEITKTKNEFGGEMMTWPQVENLLNQKL